MALSSFVLPRCPLLPSFAPSAYCSFFFFFLCFSFFLAVSSFVSGIQIASYCPLRGVINLSLLPPTSFRSAVCSNYRALLSRARYWPQRCTKYGDSPLPLSPFLFDFSCAVLILRRRAWTKCLLLSAHPHLYHTCESKRGQGRQRKDHLYAPQAGWPLGK